VSERTEAQRFGGRGINTELEADQSDAGGPSVSEHRSNPVFVKGVKPYGEGDPVDLLLSDGLIAEIGPGLAVPEGAEVIDVEGLVALPGLVDLHTHLREPGGEDAETVDTGSAAAALGGFTAVFAMPNTDPVADNAVIVEHVRRRGLEVGLVDVHPVGAVTVGLAGQRLAELGTMAASAAGVRVFSDDGHCVHDPLLMRRALEYATALDVVIAQHAEDPRLTGGAQAHEGVVAARLGLAGWPATAEETIVARDCALAREAGAKLHVCHVSSAHTVEVLRAAKAAGVQVSAEVTPHHLLLTDSLLTSYDPVNKVNPPLRTGADTAAMRAALAEGVIDCVATDHAPHPPQAKDCEWAAARPGMLGLQTALSVLVHTMVEPGLLDWRGVARVLSERPAEIAGLADQGRPIAVGEPATLALVDPDAQWTVRGARLASLASNTPYEGMRLPTQVVATVLRGRITARDGEVRK
jgi:dihydroorotase